jgi:hypothetical protein
LEEFVINVIGGENNKTNEDGTVHDWIFLCD